MIDSSKTRASINIWRTRSNFRHIFTIGHEILWIYRSGQFGMSVIILSTETPYTAQTHRQTFRKPCKIQSLTSLALNKLIQLPSPLNICYEKTPKLIKYLKRKNTKQTRVSIALWTISEYQSLFAHLKHPTSFRHIFKHSENPVKYNPPVNISSKKLSVLVCCRGTQLELQKLLKKHNYNSDTSSHMEMNSYWYRVLERYFRNTNYCYLTETPFAVQAYHQNSQKIFKHSLWRKVETRILRVGIMKQQLSDLLFEGREPARHVFNK